MAFYRKDFATLTEDEKIAEIRKEMDYRVAENTRYHYHIAVELFNTYSFLRKEWYHFPEEHFIKDRFIKKILLDKMGEESFPIPPAIIPCDNETGLYLVGQTTFNPFTKEEFYWVKIGKSNSSLSKRIKQYRTHNPALWLIEFKIGSTKKEKLYQSILNTFGSNKDAESSKEWYAVSRKDYLKICDGGFKYLENLFPYMF